MAENTRPPDRPIKIDLAKVSKEKKASKGAHLPMASDRMYNASHVGDSPARTQLISPPPEETLHFRRTSRSTPFTPSLLASNSGPKRKRNMPHLTEPTTEPPPPLEATPNPKPRKQSKHRSSVVADSPTRTAFRSPAPTTPSRPSRVLLTKSPHAENPDADFLLPIPSSATRRATTSVRARRTTPIPAYEPPSDVFTPPKVVMMTPTISKSSKRKTASKAKPSASKPLRIVIKKELPPIDLSAPMPPASPSDDPLLLSGPILPPTSTPTRPPREHREVAVATIAVQETLPPSSSPVDDDMEDMVPRFDWTRPEEPERSTDFSSMMDIDEPDADIQPLPLFNFNLPGSSDAGGWSDSDEEEDTRLPNGEVVEVGEGEYTGRWKTLAVRTKLDPPSSATRERMEEWGRPITPFPKEKIGRLDLLKEVDDEEEQEDAAGPDVEMERVDEYEVPLAEEEQEEEEEEQEEEEEEEAEQQEEEEREVREMSVPCDEEEQETPDDGVMSVELDEHEHTPTESPKGQFDFDASFENSTIIQVEQHAQKEHPPPEEEVGASIVLNDASHMEGRAPELLVEEVNYQDAIPQPLAHYPEDDDDEEEERQVREMSVEDDFEEEPAHLISAPNLYHPTLSPVQQVHRRSGPYEEREVAPVQDTPTSASWRTLADESAAVHVEKHEVAVAPLNDVDADSSDDESDTDIDLGVVKISSADPRAAARAAAILKQHDYDCFTKIMMKQRRRSSVHGGGIVKGMQKEKEREKKRRRTTMGVIGDRVYIPGSPVVTLPQLLREAEAEVVKVGTPAKEERNPFVTPAPVRYRDSVPFAGVAAWQAKGERAWTKEEWKLLDACFTDERLEVGGGEVLGGVDAVRPEDVVRRFVEMVGGQELGQAGMEVWGEEWSMDSLLRRVKALQNKQRSGNVAPPTTPYTPSPTTQNVWGNNIRRIPSMEVPDFTPLGRRALPPARAQRPVLPPPVKENAPFANLTPGKETTQMKRKLPMSLLAPRYSHLLEEAVAVSQLTTEVADRSVAGVVRRDGGGEQGQEDDDNYQEEALQSEEEGEDEGHSIATAIPERPKPPQAPATIGKRVKGFLFSYLPTLSKTAPPNLKKAAHQLPRRPGLPLPPLDVLEKQRGPISTPVRPPQPKPKHPKELVQLHPAPQVKPKQTMIPRARKPQRMVELHPVVVEEKERERESVVVRQRRSSGGSVKDLVRNFEELDGKGKGKAPELKRVRSIGEWRRGAGHPAMAHNAGGKPGWRP
ncbi:hypothetical protein Hypma_003449 [Hypsizygus marmoreus]|uniref:Uncharacterized protein n=1 Tax=Hypsizygus marmoreus TaxID=39966 RepID=A0A369J4G0_HYPMA|nr:hypothetical protein Hypma_003449 [Hypsizygus marmoreus]